MFHQFNEMRLPNMRVHAHPNKLVFESADFTCYVHHADGEISNVDYVSAEGEVRVPASNATKVSVGEGNSLREVTHFLLPGGPAPQLRLGLTCHSASGTWSSLPHGFEQNLEDGFEEVFYYLLEGATKRALQRGHGVWCDGEEVDEVWVVNDGDLSVIPMGYHPVVGEPNVTVRYIWAYLAKFDRWEKISTTGEAR